MIKTLSPYWLSIPFVSPLTSLVCTEFRLQVFVWNGNKLSPPASTSWEITVKNATQSTGSSRINIANILNDYIQFTPQQGTASGLIDGNNQRWVKWQVLYTTTNASEATTPSNINNNLLVKGFNLGLEAENKQTPTNKVLLNGSEFKVNRDGFFVVPIEAIEPAPSTPSIVITGITLAGTNSYNVVSTSVGSYSGCTLIIGDGSAFESFEDFIDFTSPLIVGVITPATSTSYSFVITAFDNATGDLITSNTFNIFLPI